MSGNFAILQAKIGLKKAEVGKVENNSNFVTQNWSKLQGAPGTLLAKSGAPNSLR